jgi:hypothetical protein
MRSEASPGATTIGSTGHVESVACQELSAATIGLTIYAVRHV